MPSKVPSYVIRYRCVFNLVEIQNIYLRSKVCTFEYKPVFPIGDSGSYYLRILSVQGAPSDETDEQERLFGSREADLGRVSMKLR